MLGLYADLSPDLPGRLMAMAERDQQSEIDVRRHSTRARQSKILPVRRRSSQAEKFSAIMGSVTPLAVALSALIACVFLFNGGKNTGALGTLATAFVAYLIPLLTSRPGKKSGP